MRLFIGDKVYSSWSMRPWLVLKRAGAPFRETVIQLNRPETQREILAAGSPTGKVPFLVDGEVGLHDSLAIVEYLAEKLPAAGLWPADPEARAYARAATAEMHSGFQALRQACPMDLKRRETKALDEATQRDVWRVVGLWEGMRRRFGAGGPFLFGPWCIADAFFTPVATRFRSYGVDLADYGDEHGTARAYATALLSAPEYLEWEAEA